MIERSIVAGAVHTQSLSRVVFSRKNEEATGLQRSERSLENVTGVTYMLKHTGSNNHIIPTGFFLHERIDVCNF